MEYLFISVAVLCIAAQFTLNKTYQKRYVKGVESLLFFPILQGAASFTFFLCLVGFAVEFRAFTAVTAFLYASASFLSGILGLIIVRLGRLAVYMMFLMLGGMLLPFLYGVVFLNEVPTPARIVGIALLVASMFVSSFGSQKKGSGTAPPKEESAASDGSENAPRKNGGLFIVLCVCVFFLNGVVSIFSKVHQINPDALATNQFILWVNVFFFSLSALAFGVYRLPRYIRTRKAAAKSVGGAAVLPDEQNAGVADYPVSPARTPPNGTDASARKTALNLVRPAGLIVLISLIGGVGGIFLLNGAIKLPASVLYPTVTGGSIVLTSLSGRIFFGEKLTPRLVACLAFTVIGTVLFLF
jgi:drug/metabolite transporter (DMT)-like permease